MSLRSSVSRSSKSPSILKKTTSLKKRLSEIGQRPNKVQFQLPHAKRVKIILQDYVNEGESKDYQTLVCAIRDCLLTDNDITALLQEATECISLLNRDLRLFIEAVLYINWVDRGEDVVKEYQSFIVNLLAAHNYHTRHVVDRLVALFIPGPSDPEWIEGTPTEKDEIRCQHIHQIINILLKVVPMSKELFLKAFNRYYPYYNKPTHTQEYYLYNMLFILTYQPSFRPDIFHLVFTKLVTMDVNAPKSEIIQQQDLDDNIFDMDDIKSVKSISTSFTNVNRSDLGCALDVCMDMVLNYLIKECYSEGDMELSWEKTKNLYNDMIYIFDKIILPTYNTHHVQFVMFVLCGVKSTITEAFLTYLWKKVSNPNVAAVLRQASVTYIASMVARANFVPLSMLKEVLQEMSDWIHSYIANQDSLDGVNSDVRAHSVFYSVCQALFYVVAFRHKDLVKSKKTIAFLQSLNMAKMVTCRLNPLRVCQEAVVKNFAAITRKYQLVYCYTIVDHNNRNNMPTIYQDDRGSSMVSKNILNDFYPFDPYILERSSKHIEPYYVDYEESFEESQTESKSKDLSKESMEIDDFLTQETIVSPSKNFQKFSYGSSPGFRFK